jgi:hypothetical protein
MTKLFWCIKETKASHKNFISSKPGVTRFCQPNAINSSVILRATEGQTYQEALQMCQSLCEPPQPASASSTSKSTIHLRKQLPPNIPLSNTPQSTLSESTTTTATTGNSTFHNIAFQQACHNVRHKLTFCGIVLGLLANLKTVRKVK